MQEEKINLPQQPQEESVSIGALLVNARNSASLSQIDISEQLNLPQNTIKALEKDDFDALPEATYIRGYLRNYARVVGINADHLIATFDQQHVQEPIVSTPVKSKQSYDPAILWSTAAVLSILVGLIITWWIESSPEIKQVPNTQIVSIENTSQLQNSSQQESEILNPHLDSQEIDTSVTLQKAPASNEINDEQMTFELQQAMQDESENANLVSLNDGAHMITVTYMEESWTEIRDADANTLMQGLIEPGVVRNLSGKPPFEIFLGNAPGVVIEVNGLYFDHSQFSRSNNTARFQVSSGSLN
ncbi:MAG: RodZ domain-containing protein [Pseudomonadota bacterium]